MRVGELLANAESDPHPATDEGVETVAPDTVDTERVEEIVERVMAPRPIEVEILTRQPAVHGLDKDIPTKQLSVLCYLAYHRDVSSQRLRDTFWPTATNRSTADNALSQLRSALGIADDGEQRLTAARNTGNYQLSDDIGCDWTRASQLIRLAKGRQPTERIALLRAALELVAAAPGRDATTTAFAWLTEDHAVYGHIERLLVDAACDLGDLALEAAEPAVASWAAAKGLAVVPGCEAMFRVQMKSAAATGSQRGVHDAYAAARRAASEIGPWVEVDVETEDLFRRLTDRAQRAAG